MKGTRICSIPVETFRGHYAQAKKGLNAFRTPELAAARGRSGEYGRMPTAYLPVEVALRCLFPRLDTPELAGVELGSSAGAYVHYLQQARGFRNIVGIDNDQQAIEYAQAAGIPVLKGSADQLPFSGQSLDLAFSNRFLDRWYLNNDELGDRVLAEVGRCLKPGGLYISMTEDVEKDGRLVVDFGEEIVFPPEVQEGYFDSMELRVFIKV